MVKNQYIEAKNKFLNGDFLSVKDYFRKNNYILEEGYCELLAQNIPKAVMCFNKIKNNDLRADWALKLIQFINNQVKTIPSYFQIRNFLEIDLNFLIQAKLKDYVENVINGADLFFSSNPESYKFIARVLIYNHYDGLAFHYLTKAKNNFYYDPEMHLMLAGCFLRSGEKNLAKKSASTCLSILPNYYPAKKFLLDLKNK